MVEKSLVPRSDREHVVPLASERGRLTMSPMARAPAGCGAMLSVLAFAAALVTTWRC